MEAVCLGTRACVEALAAAGHTASELLVAGGATRSETWLQVIFFYFFTERVIGEVSLIRAQNSNGIQNVCVFDALSRVCCVVPSPNAVVCRKSLGFSIQGYVAWYLLQTQWLVVRAHSIMSLRP